MMRIKGWTQWSGQKNNDGRVEEENGQTFGWLITSQESMVPYQD